MMLISIFYQFVFLGVFVMSFKYRKLEDYIKSEIINNSFKNGDKLPTESELMKRTGFSRQTIRTAIKHLTDDGLLTSVQGSGIYVARQLPQGSTSSALTNPKSISMVLVDANTYIFPEIMDGVSDMVSRHGYTLNTLFIGGSYDKERDILMSFLQNPPSGLILEPLNLGYLSNNEALYREISKRIPSVFLHTAHGSSLTGIPTMDYEGASELLDYLISIGHKKIGIIPVMSEATGQNRFLAYIDAMRRHGLEYSPDNVIFASRNNLDDLFTAGFSGIIDKMLDGVTAVFCQDDRLAFKLIAYLESRGIRVPEDISVAGYDDSFFSTLTYQITTVTHPKYMYGQNAALALLDIINTGKTDIEKYKINPKLIVRKSVAAI